MRKQKEKEAEERKQRGEDEDGDTGGDIFQAEHDEDVLF